MIIKHITNLKLFLLNFLTKLITLEGSSFSTLYWKSKKLQMYCSILYAYGIGTLALTWNGTGRRPFWWIYERTIGYVIKIIKNKRSFEVIWIVRLFLCYLLKQQLRLFLRRWGDGVMVEVFRKSAGIFWLIFIGQYCWTNRFLKILTENERVTL